MCPMELELVKILILRNTGDKVAREEVVRAMPISAVDHRATLEGVEMFETVREAVCVRNAYDRRYRGSMKQRMASLV